MARDRGMSADFRARDAAIDGAATTWCAICSLERIEAGDRARVQSIGKRVRWRRPSVASTPPVVGAAGSGVSPTIENHSNGHTPPCGEVGARAARTIANHSNGDAPSSDGMAEQDSRTMEKHSNGDAPLCGEVRAWAARTMEDHSNGGPPLSDGGAMAYGSSLGPRRVAPPSARLGLHSPLGERRAVLPPPGQGGYGRKKGRVTRG
jgi:hypothetical protein